MRVMVFMKVSPDDNADGLPPPTPEAFAAMDRFTEELVQAGVLVAGAGLKPLTQSKRVAFDGARRTVVDGPYAESKELVAGFSIWQVRNLDEAVAWAMKSPQTMPGRGELEIRPFLEAADLAELMPPEELAAARDGERGRLGVA